MYFIYLKSAVYSGLQLNPIHSDLSPTPLLLEATVYTQAIESLPVLELPHPNPPLAKGSHCVAGVPPVVASGVREQDFPVSPQYIRGD
jgi:hypothetical protein